ncbi:MAG: hypothetical protein BAJALOKI2v1_510020 [Promethearchaeota archaeon]|nr:MAG: hypothetical protein BAJALOKI2v1_510020 [Candidatus Lokiarchaeota archaeon]
MIREGDIMPSKVIRIEDLDTFVSSLPDKGFKEEKRKREKDFWGNYSVKSTYSKDGDMIKIIATHDRDVKDVLIIKSKNKNMLEEF